MDIEQESFQKISQAYYLMDKAQCIRSREVTKAFACAFENDLEI